MKATIIISGLLLLLLASGTVESQSGRTAGSGRRSSVLNVIVRAPKEKIITKDSLSLYDAGMSQEVEGLSKIETGSHIVLMVDNSINLKAEPPAIRKAALAIIEELYEDDQMMVVGFNESATILQDSTPDLELLRSAVNKFERKGFPKLFDALIAVADNLTQQMQTGVEKRVIILISDGYDSESQVKFEHALETLQQENIILYSIAVSDRTRGALLRGRPKPPKVLEQLTTGTAGVIVPIEKTAEAATLISEDLRNNWYRLTYVPTGISPINTRRLLLVSNDGQVEVRTKGAQPGRLR
jgi:VWFA-related protein